MAEEPNAPYSEPVPEIVDDPQDAPLIFADFLWHASTVNDVVRLTFVQSVGKPLDSSDPGWRGVHAATILIPMAQFQNMLEYLNEAEGSWIEKGLARARPR